MFVYPVYPVFTRLSHRPCLPSVHPRGEHDDRDARKTTALDEFMGEIARFDDLIATEGQVRKAAKLAGNDKWSTAIHEVGHAVIGRVLKLSCGAVTALPDEDSAGHAIIHNPWVTASVWDVELERQVRSGVEDPKCRNSMSAFRGRILALMAGAEAEACLIGHCRGGDGEDLFQIALMAEATFASPDEWDRYEPRMQRQTRRLVLKHRALIERVAKALLERGALQKADIPGQV